VRQINKLLLGIRIIELDGCAPEAGVEGGATEPGASAAEPRDAAAPARLRHHIGQRVQAVVSAAAAPRSDTHESLAPVAVPAITAATTALAHDF
jgi:hypothetical protein